MGNAIKIIIDDMALFKSTLKGDLKNAVAECTEALEHIERQRLELVTTMWPLHDWMKHAIDFNWECKNSPFGWCAYDHWKDRAHDFCIFCGNPTERK